MSGWQSVVDADGRPLCVTKNQNLVDQKVAEGGTLVPGYPPRRTERPHIWDGSAWVIDVASEQNEEDARQERRQAVIDAKQAFQDNKDLIASGPDWTSATTHRTLHINILKIMKGMAIKFND